jgi:hypothetical protein
MRNTHLILTLILIIVLVGPLGVPRKSGAARPTLSVGLYCIPLGHQRLECHADVRELHLSMDSRADRAGP